MLNKSELINQCKTYNFPEEATLFFSDAADKLFAKSDAVNACSSALSAIVCCNDDFSKVEPHLNRVSQLTGIGRRSVDMLFRLITTDEVMKIYREAGIPDSITSDTIAANIIAELEENRRVYGDWGNFSLWFHTRLYERKMFKLGRLQFETTDNPDEIYCHIISFLPFDFESVKDSFRQAYSFFGFEEKKKPMKVNMESWMLHPEVIRLLPENSNIKKTADLFTVTSFKDTDSELWYVFWKPEGTPYDEFPCDTALQKAFLEHLKSGKKLGEGEGYFIYTPELFS